MNRGSVNSPFKSSGRSDKEGYLVKRGSFVKNWKRRWFVLKENILFYYKTPQDIQPKGQLPLTAGCELEKISDVEGKPVSFCIQLKLPKDSGFFYMQADNEEQRDSWMAAISFRIISANSIHLLPSVQELINPDTDGYLFKKGHVVKNWKKRWFILKDGKLFYYRSKEDKEPTGIIPLKGASVWSSEKKRFGFELVTADRVPFELYSNSQEETNVWVSKIQLVITNLNDHDVQNHIAEESIRLLQKREEEVEEMQQEIKQKRMSMSEQKNEEDVNKRKQELTKIEEEPIKQLEEPIKQLEAENLAKIQEEERKNRELQQENLAKKQEEERKNRELQQEKLAIEEQERIKKEKEERLKKEQEEKEKAIRLEQERKELERIKILGEEQETKKEKELIKQVETEYFKELLLRGDTFLKYGRHGKPHPRFVWVTSDFKEVKWKGVKSKQFLLSINKKESILISEITDVTLGQKTEIFHINGRAHRALYSFSIVGKERTLDLECETAKMRIEFVKAFKTLIGQPFDDIDALKSAEEMLDKFAEQEEEVEGD